MLLTVILASAILLLLILLLLRVFVWNLFLSPLLKIPGPKPKHSYLGLGNMPTVLKQELCSTHKEFLKDNPGVPLLRTVTLANEHKVWVLDPQAISHILANPDLFPKIDVPQQFHTVFGNGLLLSQGETWKRQRKMLNPSFSNARLKEFVPIFFKFGLDLVNLWKRRIKTSSKVNVHHDMTQATFDIIGKSAFDFPFGALQTEMLELSDEPLTSQQQELLREQDQMRKDNQLLSESFEMTAKTIFRFMFPSIARWVLPKDTRRINEALRRVDEKVAEIIKTKKSESDKVDKDLVSMILRDNPDHESGELRDQVMNILLAGHETTSLASSYSLHLLSIHSRVQEKLREEIMSQSWIDDLENVTMEDLSGLSYMNAVIKESLRLIPPAPLLFERQNVEDTVLVGVTIPKGTHLVVSPYLQQTSQRFWKDPEDFVPERWMNTEGTPGTYLPFSLGMRRCIGAKFAELEMRALLICVLKNFKVDAVPGFTFRKSLQVTWRPIPGIELNLTEL